MLAVVIPVVSVASAVGAAVSFSRSDPVAALPVAGGTYSLKGLGTGLCLEIGGGSRSSGSALRQAGCVGGVARQEFRLVPAGDAYTLVNVNSGLCLDVPGGSKEIGAVIQQWACGEITSQQFTIAASGSGHHQLKNVSSGLCLGAADGGAVQQLVCGGSARQWSFVTVGAPSSAPGSGVTYSLLGVASGLCLEVPGASRSGGTVIQQAGCAGQAVTAQQFSLVSIGAAYQLRNINSGLCVEVKDGRKANGTVILQSLCGTSAATSQQFRLAVAGPGYQLQNVNSGLCLDVENRSNAVGATVRQWICGDAEVASQQWKLMSVPSAGAPASPRESSGGDTVITVAIDGTGTVTTVQAAVDRVPVNEGRPYTILVKRGTYPGQVVIPATKPQITLLGATGIASDVVLTSAKPASTAGTQGSATVNVAAANTTIKNLTIINEYDEAANGRSQALALFAAADRQVYANVRIIGDQNTLLTHSGNQNRQYRQYFYRSYIEGDVDFIYGDSAVVFDSCTIYSSSRGNESNGGYITAASTWDTSQYGFMFVNSTFTGDAAPATVFLGRPWHPGNNANLDGQVLVRNSVLGPHIRTPQPWTDTGAFQWRTEARFFEYKNVGVGAGTNVNRPQMNEVEAVEYTTLRFLAGADGWNPGR